VNDDRSRAEEDLRIIRSLMERATVYRAISAPTALLGAVLSIATAVVIYWNNEINLVFGRVIRDRQFAEIWLAVLVVMLLANTFFIWREARRTNRPFVSAGMKLALGAIAPCLLVPAAFTAWFLTTGYLGGVDLDLVVVWIVSYGLALLSTTVFSPRSLTLLGWAFLVSGLAVPALENVIETSSADLPILAMGVTFGLYHLVYAACTWPRGRVESESALE
jgi:hypothetical protein